MKAILYRDHGGEIYAEEVLRPSPGDREILVKVEAAALNPLDVKLHSGAMQWFFKLALPYVIGSDLAGTVAEVGKGVSDFVPGDRVIGRCPPATGGAFADFALVSVDACSHRPEALSAVQGAAIPTAAGTAWHALFDIGELSAGQKVLIHAAAGGVGVFAVQFAKMAGAHVYATASGDGLSLAQALGADEVIDYRNSDFATIVRDIDVVIDPIGGDTQRRSFAVLRDGGHLVSLVEESEKAFAERHGVRATRAFYKLAAGELGTLVDTIVEHRIMIPIDTQKPVSDFSDAFQRQASGRARGKIVLTFA